ncbi:hypothetical protein [Pedobacter sp.]|uniref:hypothetical protein n=1 Tax=Pedobacter sp. TaxID=1411316 RepID=UPI003D7F5B6E
MAKRKTGFVPPKGKPTGSVNDTHHLKDAFAAIDPEQEREIAVKYTKDDADEIAENVHVRHVNRNLNKGEQFDENGNIINR